MNDDLRGMTEAASVAGRIVAIAEYIRSKAAQISRFSLDGPMRAYGEIVVLEQDISKEFERLRIDLISEFHRRHPSPIKIHEAPDDTANSPAGEYVAGSRDTSGRRSNPVGDPASVGETTDSIRRREYKPSPVPQSEDRTGA